MATKKDEVVAQRAKHGEKMIEIKMRFWTNDISKEPGKILPKHAWSSGVVRVEGNKAHGLTPSGPIPFHSLLDIGAVIEKVLIEDEIVLHTCRKIRK